MNTEQNEGIIITGGQFHASNVATGKNAQVNTNQNHPEIDFEKLTYQIRILKDELSKLATLPEHYVALSEVAQAEQSIKSQDSNSVLKHLKAAGVWVLDVAKEIGVNVIEDLLKKNL